MENTGCSSMTVITTCSWLVFPDTMFSLLLLVLSYAATHYIYVAGSISNGYQDPSINVPQNSTANSDSSAMCPVIMQQQVDHMVQAPGFSHHQILPANPIGANGAGCLNGQWNAMPLVQEQQPMPFSMNQSNYPLQHLGTHVGSGVDSRILENFSSYGSSDAQINGAMGSNRHLSNRAAAQKEFTNLSSYGSLPEKSLQREFNRHPPQGTQSMCAIFFSMCNISLMLFCLFICAIII